MESVVNETSVKASLGVFRIKFPQTVATSEEKRGQQPFANNKAKDLREAILEAANITSDFGKKPTT